MVGLGLVRPEAIGQDVQYRQRLGVHIAKISIIKRREKRGMEANRN